MLSYPFKGVYRISQRFGENPDYYKQFGFAGHEGLDWATPNGTPIIASASGKVVRRNDNFKDNAYGAYVVIWHEDLSLATWYCHLAEVLVSIGSRVERGQLIATSDNSGNTTGPHLHFNVCQTDANGIRINQTNGYKGFLDPMPYLSDAEPQCPQPCQEIQDELRNERDTNWNLYQDEKKAHAETLSQLQTCKREKEGYQQAMQDFGTILNVAPPTTEALKAEMTELVKVEDINRDLTKELEASKSENKELSDALKIETGKNEVLTTQNKQLQTDLTTAQTEKGELFTENERLKKELENCSKPCEDKKWYELIFMGVLKFFSSIIGIIVKN